jgi:hypothetical protein
VEHRHDQAIMSCLLSQNLDVGIPQETNFPESWRIRGAEYPFWATRNSTPFTFEGPGSAQYALRVARRGWHSVKRAVRGGAGSVTRDTRR